MIDTHAVNLIAGTARVSPTTVRLVYSGTGRPHAASVAAVRAAAERLGLPQPEARALSVDPAPTKVRSMIDANSIYRLAGEAGVHPTTVKACYGGRSVGPASATVIRAAAERLGVQLPPAPSREAVAEPVDPHGGAS